MSNLALKLATILLALSLTVAEMIPAVPAPIPAGPIAPFGGYA